MAEDRKIQRRRIAIVLLLLILSTGLFGNNSKVSKTNSIKVMTASDISLQSILGYAYIFNQRGFPDVRVTQQNANYFLLIGKDVSSSFNQEFLNEIKIKFPNAQNEIINIRKQNIIYPATDDESKVILETYGKKQKNSVFAVRLLTSSERSIAINRSHYLTKNGYINFWVEKEGDDYILKIGKHYNLHSAKKLQDELASVYKNCYIVLSYYPDKNIIFEDYHEPEQKNIVSVKLSKKPCLNPEDKIATIQVIVGTKRILESIVEYSYLFKKRGFENVRIEKFRNRYVLKIGKSKNAEELSSTLREVKILFPKAFIRKEIYHESNIIYPPPNENAQNFISNFNKNILKSVFSIQLLSTNTLENAIKYSKYLENNNYEDFWVEKIGSYYVLRIGKFNDINSLYAFHKKLKKAYPTSFMRLAYYYDSKVLYPDISGHPIVKRKEQIAKPIQKEDKAAPIVTQEETAVSRETEKQSIKEKLTGKKTIRKFKFVERVTSETKNISYALTTLVILLFLFLLVFPFIPGIIEVYNPKDNQPLPINMFYTKDPRFFDRSFKKKLIDAVHMVHFEHSERVTLSKMEDVDIINGSRIVEFEGNGSILWIMDDLKTGDDKKYAKEIYVKGNAIFGKRNLIRSVLSEGDLTLSESTILIRWAGAEKNVYIKQGCVLGIQVSASNSLSLENHCKFSRLFGHPVMTYNNLPNKKDQSLDYSLEKIEYDSKKINEITDMNVIRKEKKMNIRSDTKENHDIIAMKNLIIHEDTVIRGSIKCYGKVTLKENVTVLGNIFSEGIIEVGKNCLVMGNVFSQEFVYIKSGSDIGVKNKIKSVIGKKGVSISENVRVYGYVLTEGVGMIT